MNCFNRAGGIEPPREARVDLTPYPGARVLPTAGLEPATYLRVRCSDPLSYVGMIPAVRTAGCRAASAMHLFFRRALL